MFSAGLENLTHRVGKARALVKCFVTTVVSISPNSLSEWPPLIGCPRLLLQYICSYPPQLEVVLLSATWGRATPWLLIARRHVARTGVTALGTRTLCGSTALRYLLRFCYGQTAQSGFTVCLLQRGGKCTCNNGGKLLWALHPADQGAVH